MSVLVEDKTVSGTESLVASYFAFYYYISRLRFVSIFTFIIIPGTQTISEFLLLFFSEHVC